MRRQDLGIHQGSSSVSWQDKGTYQEVTFGELAGRKNPSWLLSEVDLIELAGQLIHCGPPSVVPAAESGREGNCFSFSPPCLHPLHTNQTKCLQSNSIVCEANNSICQTGMHSTPGEEGTQQAASGLNLVQTCPILPEQNWQCATWCTFPTTAFQPF